MCVCVSVCWVYSLCCYATYSPQTHLMLSTALYSRWRTCSRRRLSLVSPAVAPCPGQTCSHTHTHRETHTGGELPRVECLAVCLSVCHVKIKPSSLPASYATFVVLWLPSLCCRRSCCCHYKSWCSCCSCFPIGNCLSLWLWLSLCVSISVCGGIYAFNNSCLKDNQDMLVCKFW